jgi:hypothetical protein
MNQQEREKLIQQIGKKCIDKGMLIEAGFWTFAAITIPRGADPQQTDAMRMAFFAGAQHLFGTIMNTLDPEHEPTDADMRRMSLIADEMDKFVVEMRARQMRPKGSA